jgi:hypothetical protein
VPGREPPVPPPLVPFGHGAGNGSYADLAAHLPDVRQRRGRARGLFSQGRAPWAAHPAGSPLQRQERASRVAARPPSAALDPGASATPPHRKSGQAGAACPLGAAHGALSESAVNALTFGGNGPGAKRANLRAGGAMPYERVSIDHAKMGGLPCIRDLRIPVSTVLGQLAAGRPTRRSSLTFRISRKRTSWRRSSTQRPQCRNVSCRWRRTTEVAPRRRPPRTDPGVALRARREAATSAT